MSRVERRSLILIDEPESHLHPPLLAALVRCINLTLQTYDSFAIVATHSPVVVQEVPRRRIRILQRFGDSTRVREPSEETYGENVGYLTSSIFNLDNSSTDYHETLRRLAASLPLDAIEELFDGEMSTQARAYVISVRRNLGLPL